MSDLNINSSSSEFSDSDFENHDKNQPTINPANQPKQKLPPPLIIPAMAWKKVASKLMTSAPEEIIEVKTFKNNLVKFQCTDSEMFRIVQKYLRTTNTKFHTFPTKEERTIKIIIKGLPTDIVEQKLKEELTSIGYVQQFIKNDRKRPIHIITLTSNPNSKAIFKEQWILYTMVKIERYRTNTPSQCYNCQKFGHSSFYCGYPPICVKCVVPHPTKNCRKKIEKDPKCSNCNEVYTANYKKCPNL